MFKLAALLFTVSAFAGSSFVPYFGQPAVVMPVGTVLEYSLATLPAGDNWQWADGACISATDFPAFTPGTAFGACPAGQVAKPDRRARFARGWLPASIVNQTATTNSGTNRVLITGNQFRTGMKVRLLSGTVSGASINTDYFVNVDATNQNAIGLSTTRANALAGTLISLANPSNAVFTQWEDPDANARVASTTGANAGAQMGSLQIDAFQGHHHRVYHNTFPNNPGNNIAGEQEGQGQVAAPGGGGSGAREAINDGTNGEPRVGFETRPVNIAMGYIVRVK